MFTFVLKDKGTSNQGWWLKLSSVDELCDYYQEISLVRNEKVFENYVYGKEWNCYHKDTKNVSHCPHMKEAGLTDAIVRYGSARNYNILQAIQGFTAMVAEQQLDSIRENGAIYVNQMGGYHGYYEKDKEYAVVQREKLIFPEFQKADIRIKKFPYGQHFYAYVGDIEVKTDTACKWNTYEEALRQAEKYLNS